MTSLDQFRNDIAEVLWDPDSTPNNPDSVINWLAAAAQDPARLRVVLEVLGLEVREGFVSRRRWGSDGTDGVGHGFFVSLDPMSRDNWLPVLVCRVRPREEKADD